MLSIDLDTTVGTFHLRPEFEAGNELVVLFGPSGCGKSLTLSAVAGLLRPRSGRIALPNGVVAFDSSSGVDLPPQERSIGYLVQDLALFPHLSVADNVGFALSRWPKERRRERVEHLIDQFSLQGLERRQPGELSGRPATARCARTRSRR